MCPYLIRIHERNNRLNWDQRTIQFQNEAAARLSPICFCIQPKDWNEWLLNRNKAEFRLWITPRESPLTFLPTEGQLRLTRNSTHNITHRRQALTPRALFLMPCCADLTPRALRSTPHTLFLTPRTPYSTSRNSGSVHAHLDAILRAVHSVFCLRTLSIRTSASDLVKKFRTS